MVLLAVVVFWGGVLPAGPPELVTASLRWLLKEVDRGEGGEPGAAV